MDADVDLMSRERLVAEVKRLRQGIRQHRDKLGPRVVLVPSGVVGTAARGDGPAAIGTGMAAVSIRVHTVPAIARRTSAGCPAYDGAI